MIGNNGGKWIVVEGGVKSGGKERHSDCVGEASDGTGDVVIEEGEYPM